MQPHFFTTIDVEKGPFSWITARTCPSRWSMADRMFLVIREATHFLGLKWFSVFSVH
jgi:hypothetical protein